MGRDRSVPCVVRLLPIPKPSAGFYDFDEYARLIQAAKANDRTTHLSVLLGGDAGLRCGEMMMALEWGDIDLQKRQLCVQRLRVRGCGGQPSPPSERDRMGVPFDSLRSLRAFSLSDGSP